MRERNESGELMPGTKIVACDALAYLSGVNYGSVVKVLAAIDALYRATNVAVDCIVDIDAAPTTALQVNNKEHRQRVRETDILVRNLVKRGFADQHQDLLKLSARFPV